MTCRNTILSAFAFAFALAMGLGVARAQDNAVSCASAVSMTFNDGHIIQYTYDADGRKLKVEYLLSGMHFLDWEVKKVSPASVGEVIERPSLIVKPVTQAKVQYCANHVYRNGALERVDNGYGYWADSTYHYNITDYQGNIRAVVAADGTLEEVSNYYSYGALMAAGGVQPYKYGGKEHERENGLDWYDSRARWYDTLTGRTPTLDPKADHYTSLSPYLWCAGNPMKYQDPTGMYFNTVDSNQARIYIGRLNQRIAELNNSDVTDRDEQIAEVNKSLQDIEDMRNDTTRRYTFEEGYLEPEVTFVEDNTILIRIDIGKNGSYAHEIRHGGQIARAEWEFENYAPNSMYGASHKVDAYRAEYSSVGELINDCWVDIFQMPMSVRTNAIWKIDRKYLKKLYQKDKFLYGGFSDDWYKK